MSTTYSAWRTEIRSRIFPGGEPKTQRTGHNAFFVDAMIDLQRFVECLQTGHTSVYPCADTLFDNGKTLIKTPPVGVVTRVFTIANHNWDDRVYYHSKDYQEVESWARNRLNYEAPSTVIGPNAVGGVRPEAALNASCGRARQGGYAREGNWLYVVPWLQTNESVVIEWKGIKRTWEDADVMDTDIWREEMKDAVGAFVLWKHEVYYGDKSNTNTLMVLKAEYEERRAILMWDCDQIMKKRAQATDDAERFPSSDDTTDDAIPTSTDVDFVVVGDVEPIDTDAKTVSELVKTFSPDMLVLLGDSTTDGSAEGMASTIRKYYDGFIPGIVVPVWGNQDLGSALGGQYGKPLMDLFPDIAALNSGKLYYKYTKGCVDIFVINSGYTDLVPREPDGITAGSVQGLWLQAELAASTNTWKIVCLHRPPYTSSSNYGPGIANLQWPFEAWGADLVLSGHAHQYERLLKGTIPYIVVGTGGETLYTFGTIDSDSQFRAASHGCLRILATDTEMQLVFYDTNGDVLDNITI